MSKILLVEDDPSITQMYSLKFKESGYEVVTAANGADAIELAKKEKPAVVLLDIIIPQYDGFAVLEALRKDETTKNIPVVLLTNLSQESDQKRGNELGAKEYLVKANLTPSEVLETVKKYVT